MKIENEQFEQNKLENILLSNILNEDNKEKNIIDPFNKLQLNLEYKEKQINFSENQEVSFNDNLIIFLNFIQIDKQ